MPPQGVSIFKVKVGDAPERDEERVAAVREAAGRDARLTVDANRAGTTPPRRCAPSSGSSLRHRVRGAARAHDDLEAARFVRDRVDVPVALDETVGELRQALAAARAGAGDIFVVKLMKTGGILNALKINAIAEAAGITVMIGNMGESSLGLSAHFQVGRRPGQRHPRRRRRAWRQAGLARTSAAAWRRSCATGCPSCCPRGAGARHRDRRRRGRGAASRAAVAQDGGRATGTAGRLRARWIPRRCDEAFERGAARRRRSRARPERVMAPILHGDVPTFVEAPAASVAGRARGRRRRRARHPLRRRQAARPRDLRAGRAPRRRPTARSTTAAAPTPGPTPSAATPCSTRCATAAASCPRPTPTSSSSTICAWSTTATSPSCPATSRRRSCGPTRSSPTSSPPAPCRSSWAATTRSPSPCCRCSPAS